MLHFAVWIKQKKQKNSGKNKFFSRFYFWKKQKNVGKKKRFSRKNNLVVKNRVLGEKNSNMDSRISRLTGDFNSFPL